MKKHLRHWAVAVVGAAAALAFTSCAYDPYYSSVGGSYSSGYGDGYGYGNSSFSTSVFVGTGDPRWGYDPYNYSYYDYNRRCYYDPYLNGYYPIGYRPPIVYGVPHPYGYRHGYCPPPRYIHHGNVPNYHNREYAYRNSNYGWAKQVRGPNKGGAHDQYTRGGSSGSRSSSNQGNFTRMNDSRPSNGGYSRQSSGRTNSSQSGRQDSRASQKGRVPEGYNTQVTRPGSRNDQFTKQTGQTRNQSRPAPPQNIQKGHGGGNRQNQPAPQREGKGDRKEEKRGMRSLGQA